MADYLDYKFEDSESFVSTFDEVPLWSAAFGLLLLKHLELKPGLTVLDIGSGAGFLLMELAGRMGSTCKLYGIDPWENANIRAKQKINNYGLTNVEIIEGSAEKIPFKENSVDLIVSNLGVNNFENPALVFAECKRVLKPEGKLALTSNLNGHWKEFYELFYRSLKQQGKENLIPALKRDEAHRGTTESISKLFIDQGLKVTRYATESFDMKFVDGTAFLNHHFTKLGWLSTWLTLFPTEELNEIFLGLETNLNTYSQLNRGLSLTVPMIFIEGKK